MKCTTGTWYPPGPTTYDPAAGTGGFLLTNPPFTPMPPSTLKQVTTLLPHRRTIGDQPLVDWLDVVRLAQPMSIGRPGQCVSVRQLMAAWGCAQCSVSRRLRAINQASHTLAALGAQADGARIGRVVRVHRAPGFWRVVFNPSTEL